MAPAKMTFKRHPSRSIQEEKRSMNNWQPCSASGLASLSALKLAPLARHLRKLAGRKSSSELSRQPRFTVSDTGETASLLAREDFRWRTRVSEQPKRCGMLLAEWGSRAWLPASIMPWDQRRKRAERTTFITIMELSGARW